MERHLMWARFMDALETGRITVKISLLLYGMSSPEKSLPMLNNK